MVTCTPHIDQRSRADTARRDDNDIERRRDLVASLFTRIGTRPGTAVSTDGENIEFFDNTVIDRDTNELRPMVWYDGAAAEHLYDAVTRADVDDTELFAGAVWAAATAWLAHEGHEICEWFTVNGERIWDPHPNGVRYDTAPIELALNGRHRPRWVPDPVRRRTDMAPWENLELDVAQRVAERLCETVDVGPYGHFTTSGAYLTHHGMWPERDTGEPHEWTWSREILGDLSTDADTGPRAVVLHEMLYTLAQSCAHEISEWLTFDGKRVFEPHPSGPHSQVDDLWAVIVVNDTK